MKTTILTCNAEGIRLDVYLCNCIDGMTRNAAQKLLDSGRVTLVKPGTGISSEVAVKKNRKTSIGEIYKIEQDEPHVSAAAGQDIGLDVVFEDNDVIVVNKPRGMVVHPAPGHPDGTLVNALLYHCGDSLSGIGGVMRPGIVHRIDKDTSGLIIAAKNDAAHRALASQLAARTLKREYETIVCGHVKNDTGTIDAPIGRHGNDRKKQAVYNPRIGKGTFRNAVTHYEIITRYNGYAHLLCRLETGRTHQIRVHLAHIGHPVLGDRVYGHKKPELGMGSQCLHARRINFVHPATGRAVELSSPLPDYFLQVLYKLKTET